MTKRILSIAIAAAAASAFVIPAAPASACSWTFVDDCVRDVLSQVAFESICYETHTIPEICVP